MKTPDIAAKHVLDFCATISKEPSFYIPVRPQPDLFPGDCFNNLDVVLIRHGGEAIMGWTIYEWPQVFIEAEYHYTWRKKSGEYEDPTPREDRKMKILFLPDSTVGPYHFPRNKRQLVAADPGLAEYLSVIDKLKDQGVSALLVDLMRKLKRPLEEKYGREGR